MLFDLRGRGRRRTVKIVYITLALLMGGGLVLFGIGGGGAMQGGLVDAITGSSGGDTGSERFDNAEKAALAPQRDARSLPLPGRPDPDGPPGGEGGARPPPRRRAQHAQELARPGQA